MIILFGKAEYFENEQGVTEKLEEYEQNLKGKLNYPIRNIGCGNYTTEYKHKYNPYSVRINLTPYVPSSKYEQEESVFVGLVQNDKKPEVFEVSNYYSSESLDYILKKVRKYFDKKRTN